MIHEYYHALDNEVWWKNGAMGALPDWHDDSKRENNQKYCNENSRLNFI